MPPDEEENAMVSTSESIDNSSLGKHHHDYNKQVTIFACFAIKKTTADLHAFLHAFSHVLVSFFLYTWQTFSRFSSYQRHEMTFLSLIFQTAHMTDLIQV